MLYFKSNIAKYFKNIGSYNRVNIIMQLALFYFLYRFLDLNKNINRN